MGDENTKYVPEGVILLCSNGSVLTQLICDPQPINLYGVRYADENDNKPVMNIPSFVTCKTKGACTPPAPLKWIKVKENVTLHGFKPLLDESECVCEYGQGLIKIFFDKYAAEVALDDNNLSDFVAEPISSNILGLLGGGIFGMISSDYREGVGQGLKQGLQGTWNFLTHDLWQADTWKGLGKMAVIGAVYLGNAQNPMGTLQSDMQLRSLDARVGTDFTKTRDALAEGIGNAATRVVEDVKHGNLKSIGRDVGQIEYAVVEAVAGSKGAGLAVKGAKSAAELAIGAERLAQIALKSAEMLEKIKFGLRGVVRVGQRALRPADFGVRMLADNPELLRIWNNTLKELAESPKSNKFKTYLANLENGTPMDNKFLSDVFGQVRSRFKRNAEAAGHTIDGEIHHWNYQKEQFSDQITNPRNLTEPIDRPTHERIHEATSTGDHPLVTTRPMNPVNELPINDHPLPR